MPRELVDTGTGKRYVRRMTTGQFKTVTAVSKSLAADRRTAAKTTVKPGEGDRGDQKRRTAKSASNARSAAKTSRPRSKPKSP
ncbi:MAG: hypothetical protein AB7V27_11925 [Candidatus Binatia bacterium]